MEEITVWHGIVIFAIYVGFGLFYTYSVSAKKDISCMLLPTREPEEDEESFVERRLSPRG